MDTNNFGFIHEKLDIKILILYILEKLPCPVEGLTLSDLALFDGGFTWFDYTDCLVELVEAGHVAERDGGYEITDAGRRAVEAVGTSIPYTVRAKADRLTAPVTARLKRSRMIETATESGSDGAYVSLRLSDGVGEIMSLRLSVPDRTHGEAMEKRFRADAEALYNRILELMTEE